MPDPNYKPRPELETWDEYQEVSADMMKRRITDPLVYYGKRPFFSARGTIDTAYSGDQAPRTGQSLFTDRVQNIAWNPLEVYTYGFELGGSRTYFIVPEDGIYHLYFQQMTYCTWNREGSGTIVNPIISVVFPESAEGRKNDVRDYAKLQQYHEGTGYYHTTACSLTEFLVKGTWVYAKSYLQEKTYGKWLVSDTPYDTSFFGFMVASSRDNWTAGKPVQPPPQREWTDGEFVSSQMMNEQTTQQFQWMQDAGRFTSRGFDFSFEGSGGRTYPRWRAHYENSGDFSPTDSTFTIPWDGIYLFSLFGNFVRTAPPAPGRPSPCQISIEASGFPTTEGVICVLRAEHLLDSPGAMCGPWATETVFLPKGSQVKIGLYGGYQGSTWTPFRSTPDANERIWNLSVVYLGGGVIPSGS